MSARNLLALVVAALLLGLATWLVSRNQQQPGQAGDLLLPGLAKALNDVDRVLVTAAGDQVVATIQRGQDRWTVAERDGYPANLGRLRKNLIALSEAHILETKTANPDYYARLGVEDVAQADATGTQLAISGSDYGAAVIIGQTGVNGDNSYVRRAGEATSYLVDARLDPGAQLRDWLDRRVADIASAQVRSVRITQTDGSTLELGKGSPEATDFTVAGIPAGRQLTSPGAANGIGAALASLEFDDVTPAAGVATGDLQPIVARFETFDGLAVTVTSWTTADGPRLGFAAEALPAPEATADGTDASAPAAGDAAGPAAEAAPAAGDAGDATAGEAAGESPDPAATAASLNQRWQGWLYTLPGYKAEQFTRRLSDLLAAAD